MAKTTVQTLKGTRDFLPRQYIHRKRVIESIQETFERFGFEPMETPALEYAETLEQKYGEEGDRLLYRFADHGGRKVALRYDLTVPLARAMAMYEVEKPFRRYQISPVWRADKPQKGRFREFWQCDADIVGSSEPWADAEVIGVTYYALKNLGFKDFSVRVNNRKLLNGIAQYGGIQEQQIGDFFRIVDKVEKIGWENVTGELKEKGFSWSAVEKTIAILRTGAKGNDTLSPLKEDLGAIPIAMQGIEELEEIGRCLGSMGIRENVQFDVSLARGLDYYTGPIFETVIEKPSIGSISGGGRFDGLIGMFSGNDTPATGTSLGLERIITIMEELKMLPAASTLSEVLVTVFDRSLVEASFRVVSELRRAGIRAEIYLNQTRLKKQFAYANSKGIPLVVILGPEEHQKGGVGLKNLRTGEQTVLPRGELIAKIEKMLSKHEQVSS